MPISMHLPDEQATLAFGERLARSWRTGLVVYLSGDLGAGKTTLVRGVLKGLGYTGAVKSPTYTLIEPYKTQRWQVYHFDLYRLTDPEELEYIGAREYFGSDTLCLVEWPERGNLFLPGPDVVIRLEYRQDGRQVDLEALSDAGRVALAGI